MTYRYRLLRRYNTAANLNYEYTPVGKALQRLNSSLLLQIKNLSKNLQKNKSYEIRLENFEWKTNL